MTLPGLDRWLTTEPTEAQNALTPNYDAEDARERRWAFFEMAIRDFAAEEPDGYAAVLRAVSRAMTDQRELLP